MGQNQSGYRPEGRVGGVNDASRGFDLLEICVERENFSAQGLQELARYRIPTSLQLENRGMRETVVWRVLPPE